MALLPQLSEEKEGFMNTQVLQGRARLLPERIEQVEEQPDPAKKNADTVLAVFGVFLVFLAILVIVLLSPIGP